MLDLDGRLDTGKCPGNAKERIAALVDDRLT
jgi:hypothetical protein